MEEKRAPGLAAIAVKYGVIQGVLSFLVFLVPALTHVRASAVTTVANVALLIVLMVLAHLEIRRTHKGMMSYSQGLGSGTVLAIASAVVTCVLVFVYVKYVNSGYLGAMLHMQQETLRQRGITGAQAQQAMAITGMIMTPVGIAISSLISGVVVGFIVAVIVSIFTQKGDPRVVV